MKLCIIGVPQLREMCQTLADGPTVAVAPYLIKFHGLEAKL